MNRSAALFILFANLLIAAVFLDMVICYKVFRHVDNCAELTISATTFIFALAIFATHAVVSRMVLYSQVEEIV